MVQCSKLGTFTVTNMTISLPAVTISFLLPWYYIGSTKSITTHHKKQNIFFSRLNNHKLSESNSDTIQDIQTLSLSHYWIHKNLKNCSFISIITKRRSWFMINNACFKKKAKILEEYTLWETKKDASAKIAVGMKKFYLEAYLNDTKTRWKLMASKGCHHRP